MDAKGALWKVAILAKVAYFSKMAEMVINSQNCETVNKNSFDMAKGRFGKRRFVRKWRIWRKWQLIAKIAKL